MTQYTPTTRLTRVLSAFAALASTVVTLSIVVGLALHYEQSAATQSTASAPPAAAAERSA